MKFRESDRGECHFNLEGLSMRRVGLRRPRDHSNACVGESDGCLAEAKKTEGAWKLDASDPDMNRGRRVHLMATGKTSGRCRGSGGALFSSRPELIFFVQALLSFVGIVLIPARLSYEFLIVRSEVTGIGSQQAASSYVPWVPNTAVARHQNADESPRTIARIIFEAVRGDMGPNIDEGSRYDDASLRQTSRRSGSRVLMQTDDDEGEEDNFIYSARTKFFLCVNQSVGLDEDGLRGNITAIFDIDESQVDDIGLTSTSSAEMCANADDKEWAIEINNEADDDRSAATISAEQMEIVRSGSFTEELASSLSATESPVSVSYLTVVALGYVILYDADQTPSPATDGLGSDFISVAGPDQWWPDWSWVIVAVGLALSLCCLSCIWYYRPKHSDPPSPSGAGGGGSSHGSGGKKGMKGGFNQDYLDSAFNKDYPDDFDKATGISMDSPYDYPRADSVFDDDDSHTSDVGVQAVPKQGSALPAEPDRGAGGVEPVRQCDDDAADASTANAAAIAAAAAAAAAAYSSSATGDVDVVDSEDAESPEDIGKVRGLGRTEASGRSLFEAASVLAESDNFGSNHSSFRGSVGSDLHPHMTVGAEKEDEEGEGSNNGDETTLMPALVASQASASSTDAPLSSSRRLSSESRGRAFSSDSIGGGVGGVRHTRGGTQGSSGTDLLKELTDEERQVRVQESDAARAASLLRGTLSRVPLQPDLERAITEEEQERRREAVRKVEQQRAPGVSAVPTEEVKDEKEDEVEVRDAAATSSSPSGVAGKMFSSMRDFFSFRNEESAPPLPETVPEDSETPRVDEDESETKKTDESGDGGGMTEGMPILAPSSEPVPMPPGVEPEGVKDETPQPIPLEMRAASGVGVVAGAAVVREGDGSGSVDAPRTLGPEEKQAYSDNVDRTLEILPVVEEGRGEEEGEGAATMPMSELLARAEIEAQRGDPSEMQALASSAPAPAAETTAAVSTLQQQERPGLESGSGSAAPPLDLVRLIHNVEEGDFTLEQVEENLASPIVATPPALLRPGVGPAARGANSRGRHLLHRQSMSGSYVSSRSTSVTEDVGSNPALTEDDMSSDAQTTDVSRTSSYLAGGSSFEEGLAQAQAASGHFHGSGSSGGLGVGAGAGSGAHESGVGGGGGGGGAGGDAGGAQVSSLAEHLARAEEAVGREHEKGLLYRQGAEKVAAVVTGEDLPVHRGGAPGGGDAEEEGEEKIESLADLLKKADDGPGNLKDMFRRLDEMEAKRLEELNAAAAAEGADDETKARWRGSLAELMLKVDRAGNLRDVLDLPSEGDSGASMGQPSLRSDPTYGTGATWRPEARPE